MEFIWFLWKMLDKNCISAQMGILNFQFKYETSSNLKVCSHSVNIDRHDSKFILPLSYNNKKQETVAINLLTDFHDIQVFSQEESAWQNELLCISNNRKGKQTKFQQNLGIIKKLILNAEI